MRIILRNEPVSIIINKLKSREFLGICLNSDILSFNENKFLVKPRGKRSYEIDSEAVEIVLNNYYGLIEK